MTRHSLRFLVVVPVLWSCSSGGGGTGTDAVLLPDAVVDSVAPDAPPVDTSACKPACAGKKCGPDGCGGTCGICPQGLNCVAGGKCSDCLPKCDGKTCGDDGCGGSCGPACPAGKVCTGGTCVACKPKCEGKQCGTDACGGSCGTCPAGKTCSEAGSCEQGCGCEGRECGPDSCGKGDCGTCPDGKACASGGKCIGTQGCDGVTKSGCCDGALRWACEGGQKVSQDCSEKPKCGWSAAEGGYACGTDGKAAPGDVPPRPCPWTCEPKCEGKDCGDDGCGGACGSCPDVCTPEGKCCKPDCKDAECGADGCSGSCGTCAAGMTCLKTRKCGSACGSCQGKVCGTDGCGGSCGACAGSMACTDSGACVKKCTPSCEDKVCGPDGCGGTCGQGCGFGSFCDALGKCTTTCSPACTDSMACGPDGCGGMCGSCPAEVNCTIDRQCGNVCTACPVQEGCLHLGFEEGNLAGWVVAGEAKVVPSLGATKPLEGTRMLDLSNRQETDGTVSFQVCVPAAATTLSFSWRLYSEEFKEWCGSQFQDFLRVSLAMGAGPAQKVFERTIDSLCPQTSPECPKGCGSSYVGLVQSDVQFDQGDTWMTPWQVAHVPIGTVTAGQEKTVTLTFLVGDTGDAIYETHVLIDDIAFTSCAGTCGTAVCGADDGCGGTCGWCEPGWTCAEGKCTCAPACLGKECGPDGCGAECGTCADGKTCTDGKCG